ncbi:Cyclic-di-GMP-binding biofilm dispersal mediator protein [Streptomyces sp. enrichment culture]|uniref:SDR family NAD(P)-dependent oxidoreductase n=1 Tax=Streptomyces sp. enrichment culture TaxID=1795815 RepID=UPI003F54585E
MNGLEGKVALVTGGSRGIGAAIALRLAAEGADVAVTYVTGADRAAGVVRGIERAGSGRRGLALAADSADPAALTAAVDAVAAAFGRLDILVNNAAVFAFGAFDALEEKQIDHTLAVNVRAPLIAARAAARHMSSGGRVISIGSNVAERAPFPGMALYALSKSALTGMTKGLARDLGPRGIAVTLVHPGPTDTEANPADGPNAETFAGFTALGRFAQPAEVAATVAHLAGPDGGYLTGTAVHVDGGFTA